MTKIDIFSGFLGAGKTTLIKKLMTEAYAGEKLVLIENEFGEVGIDDGFLRGFDIEISEINSGCICCTLVGDFRAALKEVLEKYGPDRVIIEPSGVGGLSDVIRAAREVADEVPDLVINGLVTVVDAKKGKMYMKNFGEFFNDQVENARTIVLSRTDKLTEEQLAGLTGLLREKNPRAAVITTPWTELEGGRILEAIEDHDAMAEHLLEDVRQSHDHGEDCACGCHDHEHEEHGHGHHDHDHDHHHHDDHEHHHHHADEVFTSWGAETPRSYTEQDISRALTELDSGGYGEILRAKGIVPGPDGGWIHFDYTPGEYEVRQGGAEYTGKLCVIGTMLHEDKLNALFRV